MKHLVLAAVAALAFVGSAQADVIDDPLHGFCAAGCADNGTNTPIGDPVNFGFTSSPENTGTLQLKFLIPNNLSIDGTGIEFTGTSSGTATLFSTTAFTSGQLDTYLGFGATPANPIGAYLPSTQAVDPGATGFFVYTALTDVYSLPTPGNTPPDIFSLVNFNDLPTGSYILANLFLANGSIIATANSGALFHVPGPIVGAGLPGLIAASLALVGLARRRRNVA